MDPIFLIKDKKAQGNSQNKYRYENVITKVKLLELLYIRFKKKYTRDPFLIFSGREKAVYGGP